MAPAIWISDRLNNFLTREKGKRLVKGQKDKDSTPGKIAEEMILGNRTEIPKK